MEPRGGALCPDSVRFEISDLIRRVDRLETALEALDERVDDIDTDTDVIWTKLFVKGS